ncbi:MAG: TIGR00366 family protein, partial [Candidatus Bipolaricaulaceae bacterium]
QRLDDSRVLGLIIVALAAVYFGYYFYNNGFALSLNIVIGLFLFLGLLLHGTPERYMRAVQESVGGISGIVIQFPFYAGIMGMMIGANADGMSLGKQITDAFVAWSNADTFPMLAFLSAGVVNFFVPSGGGQWAVQGPIMLPAGQALGVAPEVTAMAIAWGDAWTNMIQPFWALPLLAIAGLGRIGEAVARRARGFGMSISYWSRTRRPDQEAALGLEWRVLGDNPKAARYLGLREGRLLLLVALLSGLLAGVAGVGEVAGIHHKLLEPAQISLGYGFTAILVAWLARGGPLFTLLTAPLMGVVLAGGDLLKLELSMPFRVVDVFAGLMLLALIGAEALARHRVVWRR